MERGIDYMYIYSIYTLYIHKLSSYSRWLLALLFLFVFLHFFIFFFFIFFAHLSRFVFCAFCSTVFSHTHTQRYADKSVGQSRIQFAGEFHNSAALERECVRVCMCVRVCLYTYYRYRIWLCIWFVFCIFDCNLCLQKTKNLKTT